MRGYCFVCHETILRWQHVLIKWCCEEVLQRRTDEVMLQWHNVAGVTGCWEVNSVMKWCCHDVFVVWMLWMKGYCEWRISDICLGQTQFCEEAMLGWRDLELPELAGIWHFKLLNMQDQSFVCWNLVRTQALFNHSCKTLLEDTFVARFCKRGRVIPQSTFTRQYYRVLPGRSLNCFWKPILWQVLIIFNILNALPGTVSKRACRTLLRDTPCGAPLRKTHLWDTLVYSWKTLVWDAP